MERDSKGGKPINALGIALVVLLVATAVVGYFIVRDATNRQKNIQTVVVGQAALAARDDCRAVISAARRDVFDQINNLLDLDRTVHDQILGNALLGSVSGTRATAEDIAAYQANNTALTADVELSRTLVPTLPAVDAVVAKGGDLPVVHQDRSVTTQHFNACPLVPMPAKSRP